jgi:asparagine synthase (glutamine-hydrolysing)
MCGIAGKVGPGIGHDHQDDVLKAAQLVSYRGPNGCHVDTVPGASFSQARLSIIDLHQRSDQPFWSSDRRYMMVYNGEIYNYLELRSELVALGWTFRTEGDTEVVIAAYQQWGDACWNRMNGMWAVAIWDTGTHSLTLSRDRFGVKPLYYSLAGDSLVFGSEIKQVQQLIGRTPDPNWREVLLMLDRRNINKRETVFLDIYQLENGSLLTYRLDDESRPVLRPWYAMSTQSTELATVDATVQRFRELFIDSVRLRLRSDVPVGICLSGGLDSSAIACVMARELGVTPHAFSVVYQDPRYSEERYMDAVVAHTGANGEKIFPSGQQFIESIQKIVWHHDEPLQMPGTFSQWGVMSLAGKSVRVVLDGQGGDEVAGGYPSFHPALFRGLVRDLVSSRAASAYREIVEIVQAQGEYGSSLKHLIGESLFPSTKLPSRTLRLLTKQYATRISDTQIALSFRDALATEMYRQFDLENLPMLLKYEDRISMAHSIESRAPFMDYRLVEFCFGLPYQYKIKGSSMKWILRQALQDLLPAAVRDRRDKKGFPTPLAEWMKCDVGAWMRSQVGQAFEVRPELREIFQPEEIDRCFVEHHTGRANHERILFRVFTTILWYRQWYS